MTRAADHTLLEFCVEQHTRCDPNAWRELPARGVPADTAAAAALFLSASAARWYGHTENLRQAASLLAPGASFPALARHSRFDFARFGPMLRTRLRHARPLS